MNELEKQFDSLKEQIMAANMHFDLYKKLHDSVKEYSEPMNKSKNFWNLTLNSHLESTYTSLCRIYDKTKKSNNIENLLKKIKVEFRSKIDASIENDIDMVSKNNEIVKKLIQKYRNNYIAHTSINCILQNHAPLEGSQLTIGEINVLIKNASDMINKYANKLFNKSYIFLALFEYNDHEFILGAIQECHLKNKNYIQKLISKSK